MSKSSLIAVTALVFSIYGAMRVRAACQSRDTNWVMTNPVRNAQYDINAGDIEGSGALPVDTTGAATFQIMQGETILADGNAEYMPMSGTWSGTADRTAPYPTGDAKGTIWHGGSCKYYNDIKFITTPPP